MKRSIYIIGSIVILVLIVSILFFSGLLNKAFTAGVENLGDSGVSWEKAGTYGPKEGLKTVVGDASVTAGGVKLRNMVIAGDLLLEDSIESETVTLQNVIVSGEIKVLGASRVTISDGQINEMAVNKKTGAVTIITEGNAVVWNTDIMSECQLEEKSGPEITGFGHVSLVSEAPLTLSGNFSSLTIKEPGVVNLVSGRIDKVGVESEAKDSTITMAEQTEVGLIEINAVVKISGKGKTQKAVVLANGAQMEQDAGTYEFGENISISAGGVIVDSSGRHEVVVEGIKDISLDIGKSDTRKVTFTPKDAAISVSSGNNSIATVSISGNTITVNGVAAGNTTITVKGTKDDYTSGETSFKVSINSLKVRINSISNMTLNKGGSGTRSITVSPGDAKISVSSNNTGVASVSLSGKTVTIKGKNAGTATITVSASKNGYSSGIRRFTVTVKGKSGSSGGSNSGSDSNSGSKPGFSFKVSSGLVDPAKKLAVVTLNANDPQNYNVYVGGHKLVHRFDSTFSLEVPEADAVKSKVKIVRK